MEYFAVQKRNRTIMIKEAADYLGVSRSTLRNWHKSGKLVPRVHPVTKFRYYTLMQLNRFLEKLKAGKQKEIQTSL